MPQTWNHASSDEDPAVMQKAKELTRAEFGLKPDATWVSYVTPKAMSLARIALGAMKDKDDYNKKFDELKKYHELQGPISVPRPAPNVS